MARLFDVIASWDASPFASFPGEAWDIVAELPGIVRGLLDGLGNAYRIEGDTAVHHSAEIEGGAILKGPLIIGPNCRIANGSLLRGGCWLDGDCVVGPGVEVKSTIAFRGTRLAHFNFVGDSVLGRDVNLEAGAIVANYRNELSDPHLQISYLGETIQSHVHRFGALVGDGSRIGANAVIAPGAILAAGTVVPRLGLLDQRPRF